MIPREHANLPAVMNTYTLVPKAQASDVDAASGALPITHYWWVIWKRRWWIALFMIVAAFVTLHFPSNLKKKQPPSTHFWSGEAGCDGYRSESAPPGIPGY